MMFFRSAGFPDQGGGRPQVPASGLLWRLARGLASISVLASVAAVLTMAAVSSVAVSSVAVAGVPPDGREDAASGAASVSFARDVMPVLSKAGCNMGACHGNLNGKGGFKLSLRGESPDLDYDAIVNGGSARRVLIDAPGESYLLKKPTGQTAHEGGKRFEVDSPEHALLLRWIRQGALPEPDGAPELTALEVDPPARVLVAPESQVQVRVTATFSDGSQRDVSRWAVYEPFSLHADVTESGLVNRAAFGEVTISVRYLHLQRPVRLAFVEARPHWRWEAPEPANVVDVHVFDKLRTLRMNPSAPCSDTEFVRRAWLDVAGRLPAAEQARAFVEDADPEKRSRLVDRLLELPEFADHWALKWSDILRIEEKVLDRRGVEAFHGWIRDSIASGMPMDAFAREILTATGSTYSNPPANYYRALRDPAARAEATAQVFLGTRLQCARCHNHPYEKWTQDQYYELAAAFDGIDYAILENQRRDGFDKHQFRGEQIVVLTAAREQRHPRTQLHPAPTFLGTVPQASALPAAYPVPAAAAGSGSNKAGEGAGALPAYAANRAFYQSLRAPVPEMERMLQLADWMTAPGNPLFARTQVNRIWFQLMGQGIIDPVDDLRATNPPVNPALLDALVAEFIASGHDLRGLIRTIMNSRVYQLSSIANASNAGDSTNFSRARIERLTAEQLLDAVHQVAGVPLQLKDEESGTRAGQAAGVLIDARELEPGSCEQFLKVFGKPERLLNSDLERSNATSLAQVLELTSGQAVHRVLRQRDNRIGALLNSGAPPADIIGELFWTALSRPPTSEESTALTEYLGGAADRRAALEDIVWSLINSTAFLLRH